jgi:aldehyde:ferredoxin oxidoreductase
VGAISSKETPLRITETPYFKRKHHEVSSATFKRNKIKTASNCMACHQEADRGNFSEDDVRIPK